MASLRPLRGLWDSGCLASLPSAEPLGFDMSALRASLDPRWFVEPAIACPGLAPVERHKLFAFSQQSWHVRSRSRRSSF